MPLKQIILSFIMAGVLISGCSRDASDKSKPIVTVNDYTITEDNLRKRLATVTYYQGGKALSMQDKKDFVEQEIKKELLIQEAMRLGLDKEESFRQAIEKFWEQSLLTAVIKRRLDTVQKNTIVTADEVKTAYNEMKNADPNYPPLEKMSDVLERNVLEKKKAEALNTWTEELRTKARIEVFEKNLEELK